eukprot:CAMPEP_0178986136 /NCGR_PEP_ID=MMETSP0795-20121207/2541_1 /TAXON_ID=88552 /ORGANISM="Amoebophrya sp., Strain Ameob2" /LENGTH=169 /DNA_ID=CAMNT_0020677173 /DNA_START=128 /DNA_END=634 /DNA_ORIENTATION=+
MIFRVGEKRADFRPLHERLASARSSGPPAGRSSLLMSPRGGASGLGKSGPRSPRGGGSSIFNSTAGPGSPRASYGRTSGGLMAQEAAGVCSEARGAKVKVKMDDDELSADNGSFEDDLPARNSGGGLGRSPFALPGGNPFAPRARRPPAGVGGIMMGSPREGHGGSSFG